jgi:hypothetical protein
MPTDNREWSRNTKSQQATALTARVANSAAWTAATGELLPEFVWEANWSDSGPA